MKWKHVRFDEVPTGALFHDWRRNSHVITLAIVIGDVALAVDMTIVSLGRHEVCSVCWQL
jgi:hypothetical protein